MIQDLDGPTDNGRYGWGLTVSSFMWFLSADVEFSLNLTSLKQLMKRVANTASRFGVPEEQVVVGLYLLRLEFFERKRSHINES